MSRRASDPDTVRPWHILLARIARTGVLVCAFALTLPWISRALAGRDDRLSWAVDLAAHWQWLYLAGLVLGSLVASTLQKRWLIALFLIPLPWWSAAPRLPFDSGRGTTLGIASANVHVDSRSPTLLHPWLMAADADVVVLVEVSPPYAEGLKDVPGYPHRHLVASADPFGMAVLSRYPMRAATLRDSDGIARIEARIDVDGHCVQLIAVHPVPPLSPRFHATRDALLRDIARQASDDGLPMLVVGDLNATPWSSAFAGLAEHGVRRASGLQPTWPSAGKGWIGIPIDHVLASRHWAVRETETGPNLRSDHLPLLTRLVPLDVERTDCTL